MEMKMNSGPIADEEQERVENNIAVIIEYLGRNLPNFVIEEIKESRPVKVEFNLINPHRGDRLVLTVLWQTLADQNNTPLLEARMTEGQVPNRLRTAKHYTWSIEET
jgi:hypothetical protein